MRTALDRWAPPPMLALFALFLLLPAVLPRLGGLLALALLAGWWATRAFRAYQRAL